LKNGFGDFESDSGNCKSYSGNIKYHLGIVEYELIQLQRDKAGQITDFLNKITLKVFRNYKRFKIQQMNKQDENKLVMMKALLSYLKQNQAIWQNSQPFVSAVNELENLIAAIELTRQSTDLDQSGLVTEKNTLKAKLISRDFELTSQIYAMAGVKKDRVLQAQVNTTKSELDAQRGGELVSNSRTFVSIGRTYLNELGGYAIDAATLDSHEQLITAYENSLPNTRISVSERKMNNEKLKTLFANAKQLLSEQLKRMMVRYQSTNPDFYAGYLNASKIVDYGIRHEKQATTDTAD